MRSPHRPPSDPREVGPVPNAELMCSVVACAHSAVERRVSLLGPTLVRPRDASGSSPIEVGPSDGHDLSAMEWTSTLSRRKQSRMIAGVAGGLADRLGVPDAYVRAAFLTLLTVWGAGAVIYGVLWALSYDRVEDVQPRET